MPDVVTPDWVKHAVFYQIFPDRFASSDRVEKPGNLEPWNSDPTPHGYKGGDLLGVVEHLDYLQELGVTALSFNPIFQSACNHRYHTHDYFRVDPLLGGDDAFNRLLQECHRRDMRVVLDGVFNHASRGFFQFNDVLENGASSPWLGWWTFAGEHPANAYDHARPPGYTAWADLHALPKFNTDNEQVREYLMRVGEYWVRRGIDGWRLDVAQEITSPGFWQEFRQRVKAINPDAYIVAEIWEESVPWLQGDQFDAVMNYPLTEALIAFAAGPRVVRETVAGRSYAPWPGINGLEFAARVDRLLSLYPWEIQLAQLNLLDSHDTSRFLSIAGGDVASVKLGALLMFTFPGAPSIYYGDEIGVTGALPDHWVRKTFPWDRPAEWNHDLLAFYRDVIALRRAHAALRIGTVRTLAADRGSYVFERSFEGETLLIAINVADAPVQLPIQRESIADPALPPQVLFATEAGVSVSETAVPTICLSPRSGAVVALSAASTPVTGAGNRS